MKRVRKEPGRAMEKVTSTMRGKRQRERMAHLIAFELKYHDSSPADLLEGVLREAEWGDAIKLLQRATSIARAMPDQILSPRLKSFFDVVAAILPKRLAKEDVGDALECLAEWKSRYHGPAYAALLVTKLFFMSCWLLVAAAREIISAGLGKLKGSNVTKSPE